MALYGDEFIRDPASEIDLAGLSLHNLSVRY